MARADMPDYYAILGVEKSATDVDVKRAYRQLSRTAHPDAGGNPALFQMITLAYNTLKDPSSRKEYDSALASPSPQSGYAEEDIQAALAEQERLLRAQWEAETLRWATEQTAAAPSAPPPQWVTAPPEAPPHRKYSDSGELLLDPEEERYYRRLRGAGFVLTGTLFLLAYLLRAFGLLSFLDPGEGFLHSSTQFLDRGVEPALLLGALGLAGALEYFLAPAFRVIVTAAPWARRLAGASLFWIVILGEYLALRPAQLIAAAGVALFMTTLILPEPLRHRMFEVRQHLLHRLKSPFQRH